MTPESLKKVPRIGVFLSGTGRTLVNLYDAIESGELRADIALVIASRECAGIERAHERGIEARITAGDMPPTQLDALVDEFQIDWLVCAGYLRLLPITERVRGRIVNIHPALLPSFGGPGMHGDRVHRAVIDAGCRVSGCTVHLCDDRYDSGPILAQSACPVLEGDAPETLAARVFQMETMLYPLVLDRLLHGGYRVDGHRAVAVTA